MTTVIYSDQGEPVTVIYSGQGEPVLSITAVRAVKGNLYCQLHRAVKGNLYCRYSS